MKINNNMTVMENDVLILDMEGQVIGEREEGWEH